MTVSDHICDGDAIVAAPSQASQSLSLHSNFAANMCDGDAIVGSISCWLCQLSNFDSGITACDLKGSKMG